MERALDMEEEGAHHTTSNAGVDLATSITPYVVVYFVLVDLLVHIGVLIRVGPSFNPTEIRTSNLPVAPALRRAHATRRPRVGEREGPAGAAERTRVHGQSAGRLELQGRRCRCNRPPGQELFFRLRPPKRHDKRVRAPA